MACPVLRSYQTGLRSSVATPSWTMRFAELAPLLLPQPDQGLLVLPHDDPGIGAADEVAAVDPRHSHCHLLILV
jgi:hypothetical protein